MAFNFGGIRIPQISLPKISRPSLPKISLPKITVPKITVPKITVPKITIPKITVPKITIPKITIPKITIPKVTIPKVTIPKIGLPTLPKITIPKIGLPTLPKITIPKFSLPKVTVPDLPKVIPKIITFPLPAISLPMAVAGAVGGAVAGAVPEIKLPELPKFSLPKFSLPEIKFPEPAKPAWSGTGTVPGRIISPEEAAWSGIPTGGVSKGGVSLAPREGGNVLDVVIGARNKSYEVGLEQAFTGNVAGGGAQFGATMAADVILPLDLIDAGNLWMTGRGDQIDGEVMLGAAIDGIGLLGSVFTFGGSYAASRALKAGLKTAKVGGKMGKFSGISKLVSGLAGRTGKMVPKVPLKLGKTAPKVPLKPKFGKGLIAPPKSSKIAPPKAPKAPLKPVKTAPKAPAKPTSGKPGTYKSTDTPLGSVRASPIEGFDALKAAGGLEGKLAGKTGKALRVAGLGLGAGAIGLTALGALGGPGPQEVPPGGEEYPPGGEEYYPWWVTPPGGEEYPGYLPSVDPYGGEEPWSDILEIDPMGPEHGPGYDPLGPEYDPPGYYPPGQDYLPGYPDPLGLEYYAQELAGYGEELPVVGGVVTKAKTRGLVLPLIIGAVVLVVLVVAVLRSKRGTALISGAKQQVSGAVSAGKKAVGA